ncbi:hypothetical protein CCR94_16375 [Rhodoblastus sphagnicola]|uniref:Uncharacterized protein n=1 Tax=Rhodoblastus sphagnicola TaxID=333368 RepID=A0A2S6N2Z6_9HYPH|nr:hypothetical protein [Rhodoblastus sphagnicola]MBB4199071.1 hypothetical protein [Rhodoblastus sphagnicola]PPQ28966.1 hypothetical protein CCR94_16375 [Rhodoblastus sphagnicola]
MSRAGLIEAEARRRATEGGFDPDMLANKLSSFDFDPADDEAIWRKYALIVEGEIARLEEAGFILLPARDDAFLAVFTSVLARLGRLMGMS